MKPLTFMHAADLHLDSPFKGVTAQSPGVADALRSATFGAFESLVELCVTKEVQFLLLAGDVYDGADRGLRAQLRFRDGLARLAGQGIESFVVHGNHDALDGWSSAIAWPEGVHILGKDDVETIIVERAGKAIAAVSGISYAARKETRNLAKEFHAQHAGLFQIALLHCNCGGDTRHEPYAPCQLANLTGAGFDYWALGHVHERALLNEDPCVAYPGNTQGRNIRELGERGCYLVTVDADGRAVPEFHALDAVRWLTGVVRIEDLDSIDALERAFEEALDDIRDKADGRPVVCRIAIEGRGPLYAELRREGVAADLLEHLRDAFAMEAPFVWVEEFESNCLPAIDLASRREGRDFVAQVLGAAEDIRGAGAIAEALEDALADLFDNSRVRKALDELSEDEAARLLGEAELLCLDMLEGAE